MTSKSVMSVALLCTATLALGFGLGHFGAVPSPTAEQPQSADRNLTAELERAQTDLARMREEKSLLASVNLKLRHQIKEDFRKSAATKGTADMEAIRLEAESSHGQGKATASVLAGSLRDDGPLPDTITDMNEAQDAYAAQLIGAGVVVCLGSMLHSIATGNMLPSWVKLICVDINPAVVTKVSDRGTGQAIGVVTDVGLFLHLLRRALCPED